MIKSAAIALAVVAVALTGAVAGAQAANKDRTHLMWYQPYKAAPYAVWHKDADCPTMRGKIR